jgi:hypothetical protein
MTNTHEETSMDEPVATDTYWQEHRELFTSTLPSHHRADLVTVWGRVHVEEERYAFTWHDKEIFEVEPRRGIRTYVCMQPFYYAPQYYLPVALYSRPTADGTIGVSTGPAALEEMVLSRMGNAWALYYPGVTTWLLWECYVDNRYRTEPFADDPTMHQLWATFEALLMARTPDATGIVTLPRDPIATEEAYQAFLAQHGYGRLSDRAWGKRLTPTQ